ncbi:unnamed protein product, partial [Vitis vinifera]
MIVGTVCAMANGMTQPLMTLIFGQLINTFGDSDPSHVVHEVSRLAGWFLRKWMKTKDVAIWREEKTCLFLLYQKIRVSLKFVYLAIGSGIASLLQVSSWMVTGERQATRIRGLYLKTILRQDIAFFDTETTTGEVIGRMSGDTILIQDAMGEKVGKFIQLMSTFLGGFIIAFARGWLLSLVLLPSIPLLVISGGTMAIIMSRMSSRGQLAYAEAGNVVEQTVGAIRTVASFTGEKKAIKNYDNKLHIAYASTVQQGLASGIGLGTVLLIIFGTYGLAMWYGSKLVIERGYDGGRVINCIMAIMSGGMSLGQTSPCLNAFAAGQAAAYKMFETIKRKPQIDAYDTSGTVLEDIRGEIELKDVYFNYPARPDVQIFSGISLHVPSGKTAALVGQSGSGKSTVISLLERFYDPHSGEVLIDGVDLKQLQLKWIREKIGLVSQEPILFATTIKENISYGKEDASDEEIRTAIVLANAAKFIDKLPKGLDTMVGEHGTQLSGGQKQRIAIARAILKNPRILLLDEATSALDAESERIVQDALVNVMVNRTTVVVAHRLTTIRNADIIAVVYQGKIVEQGTHGELIKDPDGAYTQLVHLQEGNSSSSGRSSDIERLLLLGSIAAGIHGVIFPIFGLLLSTAIKIFFEPPNELKKDSRFWALMFVGLGVLTLMVVPVQNYFFGVAGGKLIQRIRSLSFEKVVHQEISWFDDPANSSGAVGARLSTDASSVRSLVGDALALVVQNLTTVIAGLVISFTANWILALIILAVLPLVFLQGYFQMKFVKGFSADAKVMYEEASQVANDAVGSIRTVASFCAEKKVMDMYQQKCDAPMKQGVRLGLVSGAGFGFSFFALYCTNAFCFYIGAILVQHGKATFGEVFKVFFALTISAIGISQTSAMAPDTNKAKDSTATIFQLLDSKPTIDSSSNEGTTLANVKGDIEFQHVSFKYSTRPDVQIFRDLSLSIPSGKTVALVGESGSGKSTVISLIERFYNPESGRILLDGMEIQKLKLSWLRQQMGLVGQEPVLFNETIRYETSVGERGVQLSGGQKQRIAIARAILKDPKILLLDEATSALDAESERVVQEALDRVMVERTTVVVAHRLTTIKGADIIAVVKNGVIAEKGSHEELMSITDGPYASLILAMMMKVNHQTFLEKFLKITFQNYFRFLLKRMKEEGEKVSSWMIIGERQATCIRGLYLKTILRQDIAFFDTETTTGEVIGRMSGDTILIQDAMGEKVGKFIKLMSTFVGGFAIAFARGWLLSLVLLSSIPLLVLNGGAMAIYMAKMSSRGQLAYAEAGNVVEQTVGAIRTVASFTGEKKAVEKYESKLEVDYASTVQQGLASGVGLATTSPCLNAFAAGQAAAYKMGEIELKNVYFKYPARPDVQIFSGFSLSVPSGKTAALVGQSGSGKSTVISLLERFYDPDAGEVLIDGVNLKKFRLGWIREKIGLVSQEPILFGARIKENISYGKKEATDEEIREAIERANAAKFIDKLPLGIETMVGEHGTQLSEGQKQRIAIARAILKNPRILLLDEATSALDAESERIVQDALQDIMTNRTTVIVAHRLTTIRNADIIAVVYRGKLVEQGTHTELIKDPDGAYSQLVRLQQGNNEAEDQATDTEEEAAKSLNIEYGMSRSSGSRKLSLQDLVSEEERRKKVSITRLAYLNRSEIPLRKDSRFWSLMLAGLGAVTLIVASVQNYLFGVAGGKLIQRIRSLTFRKVVHQEISWFDDPENSSGAVGARLSTNAAAVRSLVGDALALVIQNISTVVAGLAISFTANWSLALVILAVLPLVGLQGYLQMKFMEGFSADAKVMYEEASQVASDAVGSIRTVASFCAEKKVMDMYRQKCEDTLNHGVRQGIISGAGFGFSFIAFYCTNAFCFYIGAVLVQNGRATFEQVFKVFFALTISAVGISSTSSMGPDSRHQQGQGCSCFYI